VKQLLGLLEQSGQYIPEALKQLQFCAPSGGRGRGGGKRSGGGGGGYGGPAKRGRSDGMWENLLNYSKTYFWGLKCFWKFIFTFNWTV